MHRCTVAAVALVAGLSATALPAAVLPGAAWAAGQQEVASGQPDISWQDRLPRRTGQVAIAQAHATLDLGSDFYFLDAASARRVLTEGWGNPPDAADGVLGMIFSSRYKPLDAEAWGVVVTYDDIGYVSDKDAKTTDYDKLLVDLRSGEEESNARRKEAGYQTIHLAGWAERPSYDADKHVLVWARDLEIGQGEGHSLNYDIRVLGRKGVISLNAVAAPQSLAELHGMAGRIAATAQFDQGSRYVDFKKGEDKVAEYGVAGLIAAGAGVAAAKKFGLLALLIAFGKKGAVFLIAAFGGLVTWLRGKFGGGKKPKPGPKPGGPDLIS
ncbi:DUF2167 domain-containing protein [Caulobacter endophyticus]|uniref:DUF2167 domain-containing protein n=1 Tax=Caulobacter endophyticus TaxID=2172652 RepID=UPI00240FDE12|nr:DUF2167 domain-containing protein [Caulobacter endophyticus]MDG2528776.1 DUF2167 domain-containing protein [Caulobacter endophyticus]